MDLVSFMELQTKGKGGEQIFDLLFRTPWGLISHTGCGPSSHQHQPYTITQPHPIIYAYPEYSW